MATQRTTGFGFEGRRAKATIATALAASAMVLVLALAVHLSASGSAPPAGTLGTATTQAPTIPVGLAPGCYVGTLDPFAITQVPCMYNLPPIGTLHLPGSSSWHPTDMYRPYGW
jgi:hypothetical protein